VQPAYFSPFPFFPFIFILFYEDFFEGQMLPPPSQQWSYFSRTSPFEYYCRSRVDVSYIVVNPFWTITMVLRSHRVWPPTHVDVSAHPRETPLAGHSSA
jgi:hypothetical protein